MKHILALVSHHSAAVRYFSHLILEKATLSLKQKLSLSLQVTNAGKSQLFANAREVSLKNIWKAVSPAFWRLCLWVQGEETPPLPQTSIEREKAFTHLASLHLCSCHSSLVGRVIVPILKEKRDQQKFGPQSASTCCSQSRTLVTLNRTKKSILKTKPSEQPGLELKVESKKGSLILQKKHLKAIHCNICTVDCTNGW